MFFFEDSSTLTETIQLAVAPVFLLAGIAGFLSVMSGRLSRIIDRERVISRRLATLTDEEKLASSKEEFAILMQRARITNKAIGRCTSAALLICALVVGLFLNNAFQLEIDLIIAILFIMAMLLLITALVLFLKEIKLATKTLEIAKEYSSDSKS